MEDQLRSQCRNLLDQLQSSQKILGNLLPAYLDKDYVDNKNCTLGTSNKNTNATLDTVDRDANLKQAYARDKLSSLSKTPQEALTHHESCSKIATDPTARSNLGKLHGLTLLPHTRGTDEMRQGILKTTNSKSSNFSNTCDDLRSGVLKTMNDNSSNKNMKCPVLTNPGGTQTASSSSWCPATPSTIQKRQLIDRHTNVPSKLNDEELRELNNERLLNFSYCHINVDDDVRQLKSLPQTLDDKENEEQDVRKQKDGKNSTFSSSKVQKAKSSLLSSSHVSSDKSFREQLQDDGNNRHYGNWLKETTIKPKTLLNSSAYYNLNPNKKDTSKVRFDSSASLDPPVLDQHLLGYDWIAALLDNDPNLVNQSESFFDDIRDFRKAFKDECSNRFYMETPYTLVDTEPEPVAEALTEPKVRPYVVNERLFTEPLKTGIIDYEDDGRRKSKEGQKEPTDKNPRFVRVSIPRSTLQTPYRIKPHRRGSFDGSDSCALMDHCLLGWENTRPVMMPSAKSLDLNTEAGTRIDSETTTLAEAERLATEHNRLKWPFSKPSTRVQTLPTWRKHYMNTTLNMSLPQASANATLSNTSRDKNSSQGRQDIKRATDRILSATYSTMYEMERLRQERELERRREQGDRV